MMIRLEARDFLTDALYLYHIRCSICKPYDIAAQSKMLRIRSFFNRVRVPVSRPHSIQAPLEFLWGSGDIFSLT